MPSHLFVPHAWADEAIPQAPLCCKAKTERKEKFSCYKMQISAGLEIFQFTVPRTSLLTLTRSLVVKGLCGEIESETMRVGRGKTIEHQVHK